MRIGEMSWTKVREHAQSGSCTIIPLGSIEEHGPHAPMGDYQIIDEIAARTAAATQDLVVPTLPFGYSEYFRQFPGTITLRPETLASVVEDTVDCVLRHSLGRIVIFNGHAGNMPILEVLTRKLRRERDVIIPVISPLQTMQEPQIVQELYGDDADLGHGGEPIGSVMMALAPGTVSLEEAGAFGRAEVYGMPSQGLGTILFKGMRVAVPLDMTDIAPPESGSLSDPRPATAERGLALLDHAVDRCVQFMRWFRTVDPTALSA